MELTAKILYLACAITGPNLLELVTRSVDLVGTNYYQIMQEVHSKLGKDPSSILSHHNTDDEGVYLLYGKRLDTNLLLMAGE